MFEEIGKGNNWSDGERIEDGKEKRFLNVRNNAREYKTFMPKKAGKRSLRKFMMARNMPATAPGLVTRSFKLGTLTLKLIFSAALAAPSVYLE